MTFTHHLFHFRPRRLSDVLRMEAVKTLPVSEIEAVWRTHHDSKPDAYATTRRSREFGKLVTARATQNPLFVLPVTKSRDSFFTMFCQYHPQDTMVYMTYLENYRRNPLAAEPWLSLHLFLDDIPELALIQSNFSNYLTKPDGESLTEKWLRFYEEQDETRFAQSVEAFNKRPETFDFNKVFELGRKNDPAGTNDGSNNDKKKTSSSS